jgi:hypothetical protein
MSSFPTPPGQTDLMGIAMGPIPGGGNVLFATTSETSSGAPDPGGPEISQKLWHSYKLPAGGSGAPWSGWQITSDDYAVPPASMPGDAIYGNPPGMMCQTLIGNNWFFTCNGQIFLFYNGADSVGPTVLWSDSGSIYSPDTAMQPSGHTPSPGCIAPIFISGGPIVNGVSPPALLDVVFVTGAAGTPEGEQLITVLQYPPYTASVFDPQPPSLLQRLLVAQLPNNCAQLWGVDGSGTIWSTWQSGGRPSKWEDWTTFPAPFPAYAVQNGGNAVGVLPDGRLQVFVVAAESANGTLIGNPGRIWTCWKETTAADSNWSAWTMFMDRSFATLTVGALSDGRLQLFGANPGGGIATTWKEDATAGAGWVAWQDFPNPPG